MEAKAADMFAFTSNFFTGKGLPTWEDIVTKQTSTEVWMNLHGNERTGKRGMSKRSRRDCIVLLLQTRFANDAAEQMKFYPTRLRKPGYYSVKALLQRLEMLYAYVSLLPQQFDSRDVTGTTKPLVPFDAVEQAGHTLHAMPEDYRLNYQLLNKTP